MTDRHTIKLPESLAADLQSHKREDQTWPAFVREDVLPALERDNAVTTDELLRALDATIDEIEGSVETVEERTGRIERTLEDVGAQR
jgi:hypothetical protein